jgi:DNA-binding NarL/FixJ family response regulator
MTNPKIQIDDVVREMNADELKAYQERLAKGQAQEAAEQAKIAARQSALAKLAALGLTEAEIAAL